ncbi:N-terminal acetyltransferase complex subunit [Caudoviricetes sp.]|nr:N-terminal acetyltransferase complex subunit [Caudoviricetes sp.]
MNLTLNPLYDTDYDNLLAKWWEDWGMTPVPKGFLPLDGKGGLIVYDGEIPVCAGFLYLTNSKVALVNWVISNKQYRGAKRREDAIEYLLYCLVESAKIAGYEYVYSHIRNWQLEKYFGNVGFTKTCTYSSEFIKKI